MTKSLTSVDLTHTVEILDQEVLKASLTSILTYLLLKGLMPTKPGPRPRELVKHLRYHGPKQA